MKFSVSLFRLKIRKWLLPTNKIEQTSIENSQVSLYTFLLFPCTCVHSFILQLPAICSLQISLFRFFFFFLSECVPFFLFPCFLLVKDCWYLKKCTAFRQFRSAHRNKNVATKILAKRRVRVKEIELHE